MVAAAGIAGFVFSAGADIYSGNKAADATKDAARTSAQVQRYMYDQTREDYAPYREAGSGALRQLAALYGVPMADPNHDPMAGSLSFEDWMAQRGEAAANDGAGQLASIGSDPKVGLRPDRGSALVPRRGTVRDVMALTLGTKKENRALYDQYLADYAKNNPAPMSSATPDYSAFMNSPDYQFAFDQGQRAVEQNLARRGLGSANDSGAAAKALMRFGQGLASQQLGNYRNSLASLAGIGQASTGQLGQLGHSTAQGIAADTRAAGDARASSYLNTGAAINNAANTYGQYRLLEAGGYFK